MLFILNNEIKLAREESEEDVLNLSVCTRDRRIYVYTYVSLNIVTVLVKDSLCLDSQCA